MNLASLVPALILHRPPLFMVLGILVTAQKSLAREITTAKHGALQNEKLLQRNIGQNSQVDRNTLAINFYCWHGDVHIVAAPSTAASLPRVVGVPSGGVSDS